MNADPEDKASWCEYGAECEERFLSGQHLQGISLMRNPQKRFDKYAHDFFLFSQADLKTMETPWKMAAEMFNIPSEYAVSVNEKDIDHYTQHYPNILLILDVRYPDYQGVHLAPLGMIRSFIAWKWAVKHEYQNRKHDQQGNAKASYIFDVRRFPKIHEL